MQFTDRHGAEVFNKLVRLADGNVNTVKNAMRQSGGKHRGVAVLSEVVQIIRASSVGDAQSPSGEQGQGHTGTSN